jgi:hypothetical protein
MGGSFGQIGVVGDNRTLTSMNRDVPIGLFTLLNDK